MTIDALAAALFGLILHDDDLAVLNGKKSLVHDYPSGRWGSADG
jgi:hypothetical protein